VMDGEMDCVGLFKEFDLAERYFITALDASRVSDLNEVEGLRHLVPYRDGDWLGGGTVNLRDSRNREAPPYRCRAVVIQRRTKETFTVLGTNAPPADYPDVVVADTYFHRWPAQEGVIRQLNMATAFKGVHGYGKMRVLNVSVIDKITRLQAQVSTLSTRLQKARDHQKAAAAGLQPAGGRTASFGEGCR